VTAPAHRSRGLYRLLEPAAAYEWLQRLLGAGAARRRFVEEILRPRPGDHLLDIGCGAGGLLDSLPENVAYVGYDLNPRYIEAARRRHGTRGKFYCARAGEPPEELLAGTFDLVVAKSILHHLDDREADELMDVAGRALKPGGVLVTMDPVYHPGQSPVARWVISRDRGARVRTPEGYRALVSGRFEVQESGVLTDLTRIPYSHFFLRARPSPVTVKERP
jgi:SAM-dependent methyltransferase